MKFIFRLRKRLFRELSMDLTRCPEHRAAEFHATLDNACPVSPSHPFECLASKVDRPRRGGIFECYVVETQAYLGIRRSSNFV
jgi:hypothetical protein